MALQMGLLGLNAAPRLITSASSSRHDPKIENNLISDPKFKCQECSKAFETEKSMYGHMRIHRDRGLKDFKRPSVSKRRSDHEIYTDNLLSKGWGVTKKRGSKPALDKESPEVIAASILLKIKHSGNTCRQNKKQRTMESDPLDEKKYVCERCNSSFPSHQALVRHHSSHKKEMEIVAIRQPTEMNIGEIQEGAKRKVKSGSHVCEICGMSYPTGQQLGGHKRAHYKKDPSMISDQGCQMVKMLSTRLDFTGMA